MSHHNGSPCDLPLPVAVDAVTSCGVCGEMYQAVFVEADVPTFGSPDARVGSLQWVRLDEVPESERTVEVPPAAAEVEEVQMPYRIEHLVVPQGPSSPLVLDLGADTGIIVQPMPDQADGEVALNIVSFGGLDPEVVAWLLAVASEQLVKKIRVMKIVHGAANG